ncbi:hypothetical protein ACLI1C_19020 [Devosia sp. XGJD_8]|uniref:hypothetical protein n=1 Tax=Devosia sp. XGJD_8 TaxID=3391187 RepID=UPI0039849684
MNLALSQALYGLGFRWSDDAPARFAVSPAIAAARLDQAFRQTEAHLLHLCPLDLGDDVPELRFGPNAIRNFTAEELSDLLDPDGLSRGRPGWHFDSQRFSRFAWLVVEEIVVLPGKPGGRVLPGLFVDLRQDFGRIEPHKRNFPAPVEAALFALLTAPWEDITSYSDLDWRPFRVPWVHTLSDDLFARQPMPPDADTLSWEPDFYEDTDGAMVEAERPTRLPLTNAAIAQTAYLDDAAWTELIEARRSPLFHGPIEHFAIRAFAGDRIDEFLAHVTVIEAALGQPIDHYPRKRPKITGQQRQGATARVAWRLAALLDDASAGERYFALFKARSDFLHGQVMQDIPSQVRLDARRLARRCVCALISAATSPSPPESQDAFLSELLQRGSSQALDQNAANGGLDDVRI